MGKCQNSQYFDVLPLLIFRYLNYNQDIQMKIANQSTFKEFDRLKGQMFAHKRQNNTPKQVKNPVSLKLKFTLPLILMSGGIYLVYQNKQQLQDRFLQRYLVSYKENILWQTLTMYFKCRWQQLYLKQTKESVKNLANKCYLTKLASDYLYLTERAPQKKLYIQTKSNYSFWIFGCRNQEKIILINEFGDLIERQSTSPLMIGDMRIWCHNTDSILKREKIFKLYEDEIKNHKNIRDFCSEANYFTKFQQKGQNYENIMKQCRQESHEYHQKIQKLIENRLKYEQKRKIVNKN